MSREPSFPTTTYVLLLLSAPCFCPLRALDGRYQTAKKSQASAMRRGVLRDMQVAPHHSRDDEEIQRSRPGMTNDNSSVFKKDFQLREGMPLHGSRRTPFRNEVSEFAHLGFTQRGAIGRQFWGEDAILKNVMGPIQSDSLRKSQQIHELAVRPHTFSSWAIAMVLDKILQIPFVHPAALDSLFGKFHILDYPFQGSRCVLIELSKDRAIQLHVFMAMAPSHVGTHRPNVQATRAWS